MIPVQYFQACATVIPTLLVAFLISGKQGYRLAEAGKLNQTSRAIATTVGLGTAILITAGESAALVGIINHGGGQFQAIIALAAIFGLIFLLMFELSGPLADNFQRAGVNVVFFVISLSSTISFFVAAYAILLYRPPE